MMNTIFFIFNLFFIFILNHYSFFYKFDLNIFINLKKLFVVIFHYIDKQSDIFLDFIKFDFNFIFDKISLILILVVFLYINLLFGWRRNLNFFLIFFYLNLIISNSTILSNFKNEFSLFINKLIWRLLFFITNNDPHFVDYYATSNVLLYFKYFIIIIILNFFLVDNVNPFFKKIIKLYIFLFFILLFLIRYKFSINNGFLYFLDNYCIYIFNNDYLVNFKDNYQIFLTNQIIPICIIDDNNKWFLFYFIWSSFLIYVFLLLYVIVNILKIRFKPFILINLLLFYICMFIYFFYYLILNVNTLSYILIFSNYIYEFFHIIYLLTFDTRTLNITLVEELILNKLFIEKLIYFLILIFTFFFNIYVYLNFNKNIRNIKIFFKIYIIILFILFILFYIVLYLQKYDDLIIQKTLITINYNYNFFQCLFSVSLVHFFFYLKKKKTFLFHFKNTLIYLLKLFISLIGLFIYFYLFFDLNSLKYYIIFFNIIKCLIKYLNF